MKTKKFDKIFYSISYYVHQNYDVVNELNNSDLDFEIEYINPFIKELNKNLLENVTKENKNDIIKFYLFKFLQLEKFFNNNENLLFKDPFEEKNLDKDETYITICHYLFDLTQSEIQYCCGKYNIDFWLLCKEVNLDLLLFDSGITAGFEESKQLNPKSISKHENIFCNNGFKLFEYIFNEYIKPKGTLGRFEDLSYYYRCLFDDKFIHQKPEPFRLWFIKEYLEEFSKIKTKAQAKSNQRNKDYSNALDWFKLQNL